MPLVLTKDRPSVDLRESKTGVASGEMLIRTTWDFTPRGIGLDLGVMWEAKNGQGAGAIQALGALFGSRDELPYLQREDDDRSGESRIIRGSYDKVLEHIEWFGIYLYIRRGCGALSSVAGAKTTLTLPGFRPVEVVHEGQNGRTTAILQCHNMGDGFVVTRDSKAFLTNQREAALYWGIDLEWTYVCK